MLLCGSNKGCPDVDEMSLIGIDKGRPEADEMSQIGCWLAENSPALLPATSPKRTFAFSEKPFSAWQFSNYFSGRSGKFQRLHPGKFGKNSAASRKANASDPCRWKFL